MAKKNKDVSKAVAKIDPAAFASIFAKGMMAPSKKAPKKKDIQRAAATSLAQFSAPPGKGGRSALPPSTPLRPTFRHPKGGGKGGLWEAAGEVIPPAAKSVAKAIEAVRPKHGKGREAGYSLGGLLYTKPAKDVAYTAMGVGPGLVYAGQKEYETRGKFTLPLLENIGKSVAESFTHPIRQYNRPGGSTELLSNWLIPLTAGTGAAVRGAELGSTAAALRAGEITGTQALRRAARTAWRPQPLKREIRFQGATVHPPAYKSAVGGVMQKHVADRAMQYMLDNPNSLPAKVFKTQNPMFKGLRVLSPEQRFARMHRYQQDMLSEAKAGRATYRMGPDVGPTAAAKIAGVVTRKDISAIRRSKRAERLTKAEQKAMGPEEANHIHSTRGWMQQENHHDIWNMGTKGDKWIVKSHDFHNGEVIPIKAPPDTINLDPTKWDSNYKLANYFKNMFNVDRKKVAKNPENYRFLTADTIKGLAPHLVQVKNGRVTVESGGRLEDWAQHIDNLTQTVRVGRFYHPGYVQNSIQNRVLHLSQAGMHAFRNAYWYHHRFPEIVGKHGREDIAGALEELSGSSRAQAVIGEIPKIGEVPIKKGGRFQKFERPVERARQAGETFWHNVDDRAVRMQMLYHELSHAGYNNNAKIMDLVGRYLDRDPEAIKELTPIAWRARKEAIDYGEMTPTERATLKRLFIAYGWARGASTYSARFAFQHPVQAHIAQEIGLEGHHKVDDFFKNAGGMIPDWLEGIVPVGHNKKSPWVAETGWLPPFETPADFMQSLMTGNAGLSSEIAPGPQMALEALTGRTKYGQQLKGPKERVEEPIKETLKRFRPVGALAPFVTHKPTSTVRGGPGLAAMRLLGVPFEQIRDIEKTAKVGQQLYRAGLSRHDQIDFDRQVAFDQLPNQV